MRRGKKIGNKKRPGNVIVFPGDGSGKGGAGVFSCRPRPFGGENTRADRWASTARAGMDYADRMPPFQSNIVARRP